ncbi:GLPGLI family protein [Aquiflexum sp.]|uniref:GLPGLI family protein n=1 Tax=Aquiflexum sp. TaxID=1872584 RepID=UPI003593EF4A
MKKYILAILVCASWAFISNEVSEGVITYSTKINMHKRIPAGQEEMKKMMPEFNTSQNLLVFNQLSSLYKAVPPDENPFESQAGPGGGQMVIRIANQNETYFDRDEDMVIQLREFMGKKYLTKNDTKRLPWKLGTETKEIQGFLCRNAFFTDENEREILAWYTEELRIPLGPDRFHGLPGLIMEVNINEDEMVISVEKLDFRSLKKNELKEPKVGKEITDEAYRAMMQEQMEKMGAQGGQGGFRMMIRN